MLFLWGCTALWGHKTNPCEIVNGWNVHGHSKKPYSRHHVEGLNQWSSTYLQSPLKTNCPIRKLVILGLILALDVVGWRYSRSLRGGKISTRPVGEEISQAGGGHLWNRWRESSIDREEREALQTAAVIYYFLNTYLFMTHYVPGFMLGVCITNWLRQGYEQSHVVRKHKRWLDVRTNLKWAGDKVDTSDRILELYQNHMRRDHQ